jgi:hypothetical protein
VSLCSRLKKIEEIAHGANLIIRNGLNREIASNDHDNSRVEIISEETVQKLVTVVRLE